MRPLFFTLSLMLVMLLIGCAKPWTNPDIPNAKQAEYRFDKDSTDCGIVASGQYPLSKDKQLPIYEKCMEDKGWVQHHNSERFFQKN
ncbi:MAG: hypothetical protein OCC46_12060 [Pseudodesulfovibrio sp.]